MGLDPRRLGRQWKYVKQSVLESTCLACLSVPYASPLPVSSNRPGMSASLFVPNKTLDGPTAQRTYHCSCTRLQSGCPQGQLQAVEAGKFGALLGTGIDRLNWIHGSGADPCKHRPIVCILVGSGYPDRGLGYQRVWRILFPEQWGLLWRAAEASTQLRIREGSRKQRKDTMSQTRYEATRLLHTICGISWGYSASILWSCFLITPRMSSAGSRQY